MLKRIVVLGLVAMAGLLICSNKDEHVDTDPDGGFYDDWAWRLP